MSVKGNSVVLLVDCREVGALILNRTAGSTPANTGVLLIGQQLLSNNAFFVGDIQQLLLIPNPAAAYEVCTQFMPGCNRPLPNFAEEDITSSAETHSGRFPPFPLENDTSEVCEFHKLPCVN